MRRVAAALAIALFWAAPAAAEDTSADIRKNKRGDGIEYGGQLPGNADNNRATSRARGSGPAQPVYRAQYPVIGADSAGQPCVDTATRTFPSPEAAAAFDQAQEQRWVTLVAQYPVCPNAVLPQQNPAVLAQAFWGEVLLPRPQPRIEPGWAMTGRLAYLETQAPTTQTFTRDTPLGPLTITAAGEFLVDWGDGTTTGPHPYAGTAWPEGRITHGYVETGAVDVVVTERWRATWSLGGRTGTLSALQTVGRIDDLAVHEVQAVRNR